MNTIIITFGLTGAPVRECNRSGQVPLSVSARSDKKPQRAPGSGALFLLSKLREVIGL